MNLRIKERWNNFWTKRGGVAKRREECFMSVNCPYCKHHYTKTETYEHEQETELEDVTVIKCRQCDSLFGIKHKDYHEPGLVHIKTAVELWRNPNFSTENTVP